MTDTERKRKLIEVALPLDEINAASKAYKDRKVGTIRNIHKWFAPMPLPAWRALLFAAMVDDPADDNLRVRLLDLIKRLVENGADLPDAETLDEAKAVLAKQFPLGVPTVMDPFCGGGSTLVEAQRLGAPTYASDLNPVPVLVTRTLTQLLPRIASMSGPRPWVRRDRRRDGALISSVSLAKPRDPLSDFSSDLLYYAGNLLDSVKESLQPYYPLQRGESSVAWLWARTAKCVNPVCGIETILTTGWWLSKKKGDLAWVQPSVVDRAVVLSVHSGQRHGAPPAGPKVGRGATFRCLACEAVLDEEVLSTQANSGELGLRLVAVVTELDGRRRYRMPQAHEVAAALKPFESEGFLEALPAADGGTRKRFGLDTQEDLYTPRQLRTLTTFADGIAAMRGELKSCGAPDEWADAILTIMGLSLGKVAQANSMLVRWNTSVVGSPKAEPAFGRNDLPMMWDFAETSPLGDSVGSWMGVIRDQIRAFRYVVAGQGVAVRADARVSRSKAPALVATDPPYFDAIGYADLSDFFYGWHRRALRGVHPDLYATVAAPKQGELTALPIRHGGDRRAARDYFVEGFTETFKNLQLSMAPGLPLLVVYASKEQQGSADETSRWASILTAIVQADMEITGTWPIHGTTAARMIGKDANAVATYIVMVCRPRRVSAGACSLADFNRALRRELPAAIRDLQAASILPVDLAQAAMGPGMEIYSRYRSVLDQSGKPVPVETALRLINSALAEVLEEQEGELDPESRFAVRWWETYGWTAASFGEADKTARPLGISVDDVRRAQVVTSQGNKVQLLGNDELDHNWVPSADIRPTAWEAVHHLAHRLIDRGGELQAARLMAGLGDLQDPAMALVYRLHDIAAKKGRTADQERYNALINSWAELIKLAGDGSTATEGLF